MRTENRITTDPVIIQGGMGVGVSDWRLAAAVSRCGQLGVVSGVALDAVLARRLQRGDPDGNARRALARLPLPGVAERILDRYFVPGGIGPGRPFRPVPRVGLRAARARAELTVAGNFAEVYLAKEGHGGLVGVNYLEKIQMATAAAVYGAMLAGVDYVLVGAGIPGQIPALLDAYAAQRPGELAIAVEGADGRTEYETTLFDPALLWPATAPAVRRPELLAIVSSAVLAGYLARSPDSRPDGFVLESAVAGGHSAAPRGQLRLTENGEPVYGPRDEIDVGRVRALGLPFWLAGGYAGREGLAAARAAGASGVQVGSAFALCAESGIDPELRRRLLERAASGELEVRSDPKASPAGFPFKVAEMPGTLSEDAVYSRRPRLCDLGYLRTPYRTPRGGIGYRCPAEPVDQYVAKGGVAQDTIERRCLCNGLTSTIGLGQRRADGYVEPALLTMGKDVDFVSRLWRSGSGEYHASDVIDHLLGS